MTLLAACWSRCALAYYDAALSNLHPLHADFMYVNDQALRHRARWNAFLNADR